MNNKFLFRDEYYKWVMEGETDKERLYRYESIALYALNVPESSVLLPPGIIAQIDLDNRYIGRFTPQYKAWRADVFERDNFTCAICGQVGGTLNAHHIKPYAEYPELRYELSNGITLCEKCHRRIHGRKSGDE